MRLFGIRFSFWKAFATLILAVGAVSTFLRYSQGLGATTHLSDRYPWGLWIGFDMLCGVGLAAGGFTLAAIVHIFNIKRFEPIVRPTILTALLGYVMVIVALLLDLGRPWAIWHAIIMWNPHSVMFEIAWCVMLYTTVLFLEFLPVVFERFRMNRALMIMRAVSIPIIILGVLLSTLHQSSLGSLYLIVPEKLHALWYTPYLPLMFYLSAIAVGCAMVIFESFLSSRAFRRGLEMELLTEIGRVCVVVLAVYATVKTVDLFARGAQAKVLEPRPETWFWWAEIGLGVLLPMVLLAIRRVRENPRGLFIGAVFVVMGFVLNRLNVSLTGMEGYAGVKYFPSWIEISVTLAMVTAAFVAFAFIARHTPLFGHAEPEFGGRVKERLARELALAGKSS